MFRDLAPPGWAVQQAIRWVGQARAERPDTNIVRLIDEAAIRFDLTPREEEFLLHLLRMPV